MKVWINLDMIIGRLAMGADWLNPAAAIELQAA